MAKTKALISFVVTAKLICVFVFAYAKSQFSHDATQILCINIYEEAESIFIQAGVCHNNICQKSVYVCHDGSWRLGGLEHACKFTEATPAFLQSCSTFRYQEGLAPEEKVNLCFRIDTL